jgi:hypothetical protein
MGITSCPPSRVQRSRVTEVEDDYGTNPIRTHLSVGIIIHDTRDRTKRTISGLVPLDNFKAVINGIVS